MKDSDEKRSESFFRLSYNTFGSFCILVKQIAIVYSMLRQEVGQMKQKDYYIYLDEQEYSQVIQSLIALKNDLIAQGRYTDAVDDVLIKFTKARKKKITVQYI